jgi:predicted small secreted protein
MKKYISLLALTAALSLPMTSCYTMSHKVGNGGTAASETSERQWFVLFGLIPINEVDSHAMADGATNYTVTTEQSVLDVVINIFTSWITVYSREVTVTK